MELELIETSYLPNTFHTTSTLWSSWHAEYCKRGYFHWGKISQKCWQDISLGGNFHDYTPISFNKAYGLYFCAGIIFAKKTKREKRENYPHAKMSKFTVSDSGLDLNIII